MSSTDLLLCLLILGCIPVHYCTVLQCDFENDSLNSTDILACQCRGSPCQLVQSNKDDTNWSVVAGGSSAGGDHTRSDGSGHYIAVRATPANATAEAKTPPLGLTASACLTFWYYVQRNETGELRVLTGHADNTTNVVWDRPEQSDAWNRVQIQLNPDVTYVVFRGVTSRYDNLALDDIGVEEQPCDPVSTVTTSRTLPTNVTVTPRPTRQADSGDGSSQPQRTTAAVPDTTRILNGSTDTPLRQNATRLASTSTMPLISTSTPHIASTSTPRGSGTTLRITSSRSGNVTSSYASTSTLPLPFTTTNTVNATTARDALTSRNDTLIALNSTIPNSNSSTVHHSTTTTPYTTTTTPYTTTTTTASTTTTAPFTTTTTPFPTTPFPTTTTPHSSRTTTPSEPATSSTTPSTTSTTELWFPSSVPSSEAPVRDSPPPCPTLALSNPTSAGSQSRGSCTPPWVLFAVTLIIMIASILINCLMCFNVLRPVTMRQMWSPNSRKQNRMNANGNGVAKANGHVDPDRNSLTSLDLTLTEPQRSSQLGNDNFAFRDPIRDGIYVNDAPKMQQEETVLSDTITKDAMHDSGRYSANAEPLPESEIITLDMEQAPHNSAA